MDPRTRDQLETWRRKRTASSARGISTIRRSETKWVQIQHRTFAKWVSQHTGTNIQNFKVDFIDGVIFLKLMEVLSGKTVKRYHMFPQSITQRCDNVQLALDICASEDVKLTNIGAQDIAGGSLKLILGLVWCLIQRYHLTSIYDKRAHSLGSRESGKDDTLKSQLMKGLNKILDKVKLRVNNISNDWRDGMALTALVTYLAPAFNRDFMNIERSEYISATDSAMAAAHTHLKIPRLLSAEDFTSDEVDELSMITYLSYFLDPAHRTVRDTYIREHPEYVPLYKPYIEPVQEVIVEKKSPIKKLFSSYREKLKKVKPAITDTKFYKEPYRVSDRFDSQEKLAGERGASLGSPKVVQRSVSASEPYQTYSRESLLLERETPSNGSSSPVSVFSTETRIPEHRQAAPPPGGSIIRHRRTIRRTAKNQCDKTCDSCSKLCDKTCDSCSKLRDKRCDSCSKLCECDQALAESAASVTFTHTEEEEEDECVSDSERDEILQQIFNAASVEDLTKEEDETMPPIQRFKRANTMVTRTNRPPKQQLSEHLSASESELRPFFRDHEILAEYKLLCNNVSSGVYVVPSLRSIQVWNGVVFIKIGMFAEGCFKFNLYIPDDFPYSRPSLTFITPVFHPQIKENGELNLLKAFPTWTPRKDRIWHLLRYTKRCFFSVNTFDATNPAAAAAVQESIEHFRRQAKLCVQESIRLNYSKECKSSDDGSVFGGKLLNDTQLQIVRDKLYKGTLDYSLMFN